MKSKNIMAQIVARLGAQLGTAVGAGVLLLLGLTPSAQAQVPSDPFNYGRASSYTYRADGLLESEKVEPNNPNLCILTTYGYNGTGNRTSAKTENCTGYSGRAGFTTRSNTSTYAAQTVSINVAGTGISVTTPAGTFATSDANALSQSESKVYDPRFGAVLSLTGPNSLSTTWAVDDFGRTIREQRADGTSTITAYCLIAGRVSDTSSNSPQCAALSYASGEVPADAVSLIHSEPHNTSDTKNGPFSRVYLDRAGRKIRTLTEGFDGRLIAQDVDYNVYGAQVISTQPYFLASQSSTASGTGHYGMSLSVYDVLGRTVQTYSTDVHNQNASGTGNAGGSQASITFGARGSYQARLTTITYDGLSSTSTNDQGQTRQEDKNIDGKVVRVTDALNGQINLQYDAFDNLVATKDALQNTISLNYDYRGRKVSLADPDSGLWQYDYDALGQLVWQQNANQRAVTPTAQATTMAYDVLGRMTSRVEPEYTSTWAYDKYIADAPGTSTCTKGVGKLCESTTSNGLNRKQSYDSLGRPQYLRMTVSNGPSLASAASYDSANGRLDTQTYPSGLQIKYNYNTRGYLSSLSNLTAVTLNPLPATPGGTPVASQTLAAGSALWTAQSVNAWGSSEQAMLGNGIAARSQFDPSTGHVISNSAGSGTATNVLNYSYLWDSLGHLKQRNDANGDGSTGAVTDVYAYDNLGRLTNYTVSAPLIPNLSRSVTLVYNALGQLQSKTDVGSYTYPAQGTGVVRPHALQSVAGSNGTTNYGYDLNGNLTSASSGPYRSIAYTSFNLPDSQTGLQGPTGSPKYTWQYDENHQRIKETRSISAGPNAGTRTTWMLHPDNLGGLGFECDSASNANCASADTSQRHYLSVGGISIGVLVTTGALPTLAPSQLSPNALSSVTAVKLEYWHKDHLGSLMATSDHLGNVTARYAYDPFGKRRTSSGQYDANGALVVDWTSNTNNGTDRGYTGHEHLDDVGVIHMNGRIFDPRLGMFMQADPMIQDPLNLQNYDRYTYCYNNPLTCTDPSGHEVFYKDENGANTYYNENGQNTYTGGNSYSDYNSFYNYSIAQLNNTFGTDLGSHTVAGVSVGGALNAGSRAIAGQMPTGTGVTLGADAAKGAESLDVRIEVWWAKLGERDRKEIADYLAAGGSRADLETMPWDVLILPTSLGSLGLKTLGKLIGKEGVQAAEVVAKEAVVTDVAKGAVPTVVANRIAGNAFRDELAEGFRKLGYEVSTEIYKKTIFGARFIDIEVAKAGVVLGGIEAKYGNAVYGAAQRAKDYWLGMQGYVVNVVRSK